MVHTEWYNMTPERQRFHCISVLAYFLFEQRKKDGTSGTPESDWLAAEWEEDRRIETGRLYCQSREATDRGEKARLAVLRHVSHALLMRVGDITNETFLPKEDEARRRLGQDIGWETHGSIFQIPDDVTTVGALIAVLRETLPIVQQRRSSLGSLA